MTDRTAARLVRFYPRAWRTRYGDEFMHVLTAQPMTIRLAADVLGGAIDARLRRQPSAGHEGDAMTAGLLKRCARGGPQMTTAEAWRAAGVMIGVTLAFSGLYIWAKLTLPNKELVDAFGIMAYPAALVVTMPFYYMKESTRAAKAFVVVVSLIMLAAASYLAALI